jgi:hypothetical protein
MGDRWDKINRWPGWRYIRSGLSIIAVLTAFVLIARASAPCCMFIASKAPTDAYWPGVLLLLAVTGGFGGLLAVLGTMDIRAILTAKHIPVHSWQRLLMAASFGVMGGVGGALASALLLVLDGKFDQPPKDKEKILIAASGIIAGYIGFQVLKRLADRLDKQLEQMEQRVGEKIERETTIVTEFTEAINIAGIVLLKKREDRTADPARREALDRLNSALKDYPHNRQLCIYVGRLMRALGETEMAVKFLGERIEARRLHRIPEGQDTADLLYNRACYLNELRRGEKNAERKEALKKQALADLEASVKIFPENREAAQHDVDLADLIGEGVPASADQQKGI